MDCDRCLELMSQALDGPLDPALNRELSAHLHTCPRCAALNRELAEQSAALRALDPPFPEGLHRRILDNLPPRQRRGRLVSLRRWGALAACLALALALGAARPWAGLGRSSSADPAALPYAAGVTPDPRGGAQSLAGTVLLCARLPQGWQDIFPGAASPAGLLVSSQDAQAFLALLEGQGIPYTLEEDPSAGELCRLELADGG